VDDAARERFRAQLERMKKGYVSRLPERAAELEELRPGLSAGDAAASQQVRDIVHRLSGTAGSYGLDEISRAATELELRIDKAAAPDALASDLDALVLVLRATA